MICIRPLLEKIPVVSLDQVGALLANHIEGVLDAAVGDDWDNRTVDDPEILNPVDLSLGSPTPCSKLGG